MLAPAARVPSRMADDPQLTTQVATFQRCIETRDVRLAAEVLDGDFALELVHPAPAVMPRSRWLEVLPDYVVSRYEVEEAQIDLDGDCAVVLQRVRMEAVVLGDDRSGTFVITDVWRRRAAGWRVWRRHSTPLAAGALPGVDPPSS